MLAAGLRLQGESTLAAMRREDRARRIGSCPRAADVRREDFIGPMPPPDVPDFIRTGVSPPSIFATYLSLDALDFSISTLRGDAPHHRYYDPNFDARLEVRSSKNRYDPTTPVSCGRCSRRRASSAISRRNRSRTSPLSADWRPRQMSR